MCVSAESVAGGLSRYLLVGLGNILMSDDGIGVHVVRAVQTRDRLGPLVTALDAGTTMRSLIHVLGGRRKVVIVDCARMGLKAGQVRRFTPDDVSSVKHMSHHSMHEGDLLEVLELGRITGNGADHVVILGIQPEYVGAGEKLSAALQAQLDDYAGIVESEFEEEDQ